MRPSLGVLAAISIALGLVGCTPTYKTANQVPPVGSKLTAAQENNLVLGDKVGSLTLTWQDLTSNQDPVLGMQDTRIRAALAAGKPVALFFDPAADGTQGTMEIGLMEKLRADFGQMADFIYVDPSLDQNMAKVWNLDVLHAVFLINPKGVITYEYLGLWGIDDIKPNLSRLVGIP